MSKYSTSISNMQARHPWRVTPLQYPGRTDHSRPKTAKGDGWGGHRFISMKPVAGYCSGKDVEPEMLLFDVHGDGPGADHTRGFMLGVFDVLLSCGGSWVGCAGFYANCATGW